MVLIGLAVAAEFAALSPRHPAATRARLGLNILAYLLALVFFYLIYRTRARSLVTATEVTLVAFLIALDLLGVAETRAARVILYSAVVGLVVGEATWALNYWRLDNWTASLLLLLFFYLATGIAQQYLLDRLKPAVLLEFGLVTAAVLTLVLVLGKR
jgi:intracellular septation protein A